MPAPQRRRTRTTEGHALASGISATPRMAWAGPFRPVLEDRWLDLLHEIRTADPLGPIWLLVPSRFLGLHLVRLAARAGGAVNVHVLTFTDLADRILPSPAPSRRLPPVGDLLVLRQALRQAVSDDGYFAMVREARRFPAALAATLAELRTAGVRPEDLERAAAEAPRATGRRKLRELAEIARCAEATLAAAGFHRPTDALWHAAATAPGAAALAECTALVVYGFVEWNAAERALLRAVAVRTQTACFIPAEPGPPFEPLEAPLGWLQAEGFRVESVDGTPRVGLQAVLGRLFHALAPRDAGHGEDIRRDAAGLEVVAAPGEEREIREIARRVLRAAGEGVPFETIGILVRHPEAYRSAIRDVFGWAAIPYTWGVAPRLADTRAGRSLRLLLAARQDDFARATVVEFLATANLRESGDVEPAVWHRLSREAGVVGGRHDWRRLAWLARRVEETSVAGPDAGAPAPSVDVAALHALGRIVGVLLDTVGPLPDQAPAAALARALFRAFDRLCRRDVEAEQVVGLLSGLDALALLETPISLEQFGDLLDAALTAPAEPGLQARQGKVFVGELHQALGLSFRVVFIPGLVEQGFPAPPRSDPILLDEERQLLHAQLPSGRPGLVLAVDRPAQERLAFRLACEAAEESLVLSYPRVDVLSGRVRVPSSFLLRVAEAATDEPYDVSRLEDGFAAHHRVPLAPAPPEAITSPIDLREWLLAQATQARRTTPSATLACLQLAPRAAPGRRALEAREHGRRLSAWDGLLPDTTRELLAAHHRTAEGAIAATPLETYAGCPFRYYLGHVLRIAPPVEPERLETIAPTDRGRLLHAALAETYTACRENGLLPLRPEGAAKARGLLEAAFARAETRFQRTGLAAFWRGERVRLLADLWAALEAESRDGPHDATWVPTAFEAGFGTGDTEPVVTHTLTGGRTVQFRGRLDRLDLSRDHQRARVIDYKAGRRRGPAGSRLAGGTALQLPIYRLAAEALCRAAGWSARVEEAQYYFLTRQGRRSRVRFTGEDWARRRGDFDRVLTTVLDGISAGWFFQNPSPETCRWCDYQEACGTERERIAWVARKRDDPVRASYQRLLEIE